MSFRSGLNNLDCVNNKRIRRDADWLKKSQSIIDLRQWVFLRLDTNKLPRLFEGVKIEDGAEESKLRPF